MPTTLSESDLARLLPGSWNVAATNFPMWLTGKRRVPVLNYELAAEHPLVVKDVVTYTTDAGLARRIVGTDRYNGEGFTWRGRGVLALFASHWAVTGVSDDGSVVVIQYDKTLVTPAGVDIITPVEVDVPEVRSIVATDATRWGLTPEQFASLTWMTDAPAL